jgi:hypothetical protein
MLTLSALSRRVLLPLTAAIALLGVACSGAPDERPAYAGGDESFVLDSSPVITGCDKGAVKSCTIWLGQHGDLSNCVYGVDVCTDDGSWSGCIDEETMASSPGLYAGLAGE